MTKDVRIKSIELTNFMGVRHVILETEGKSADVYSENGSGKTTLFAHSLSWLLSGKDANNKSDTHFDIKTLNKDNTPMHDLEHSVKIVFLITEEGKQRTESFKRIYREKWEGVRGIDAEFKGHETSYEYNDAPLNTKRDYNEKIGKMFSESQLSLLTNPNFFVSKIPWKDRSKILMEIAKVNFTDEELLAEKEEYSLIRGDLLSRGYNEYKDYLQKSITTHKKELERISAKIEQEEVHISGAPVEDYSELKSKQKTIEKQISKLEVELQQMDPEVMKKQLNAELIEKRQAVSSWIDEFWLKPLSDERKRINIELEKYTSKLSEVEDTQKRIKLENSRIDREIDYLDKEMEGLRLKWIEKNNQVFGKEDEVCSYCSAALLPEKVEGLRRAFNAKKAEHLAEITEIGKHKKEEKVRLLKAKKDNLDKDKAAATEEKQISHQIKECNEAIALSKKKVESKKYEENEDYIVLKKAYTAVLDKVDNFEEKDGLKEKKADILKSIDEATLTLDDVKEKIATHDAVSASKQQKSLLVAREKELVADKNKFVKLDSILDKFIRVKMARIENPVNSMFKFVQFKFFKLQNNGYADLCCEAMVDGVPYNTSLNHGYQILAGIEVIKVLSHHYGLQMPIVVDHGESLTEDIDIPNQVIRLIATAKKEVAKLKKKEGNITLKGVGNKEIVVSVGNA